MKTRIFFLLCLMASTLLPAMAQDYASLVNPLMGSQSDFSLSAGNTYPAITRPFGMNFWTPQTGANGDGWQYSYNAHKIQGLKQTHQPSPWINDHGEFSLMPMTGKPEAEESKRASWFSHKAETALPYYYSVYLADYDVLAELTPTDRCCIFRFTFPDAQSYVCIDAYQRGSAVEILPERRIVRGYTTRNSGGVEEGFRQYFIIEFDKAFDYTSTYLGTALKEGEDADRISAHEGLNAEGFHALAMIGFKTRRGEVVHARVASSYISAEQAELNLQREVGHTTFDEVKEDGRRIWNEWLGRIAIDREAVDQRTPEAQTFYTCLYRTLLFPMKYWEEDADGKIVHRSPHNGEVCDGYLYTGTGFWDTFRSLFPLLNLVYPDESEKMMEGFVNVYKESGFFPEWSSPGHRGCMVGNNSAAVMADAFMKGIRVSDTETMLQGLLHGKNAVHPEVSSTGRKGYEYYNRLGYVPYDVDINESAARTLEYAYDDWCILQIAKTMNAEAATKKTSKKQHLPVKASVIRQLNDQALNYRHLFDHETRLMRGRNADGSFMTPFSPLKWGDAFTEGNAWHYSWSVFHDIKGLSDLMGGRDELVRMLDSVFVVPPHYDDSYYGFPIHEIVEMTVMNTGNYAHGNQPIQHAIYLYNWGGQPWKGEFRVRDIMKRFYSATPDGYCGDEDNGQTSAWYVFSALGFYPVCPGSNQYAIGSPLFRRASIHFPNGNTLNISAPGNSEKHVYVNSINVNGEPYTHTYLEHQSMVKGGEIHFDMSDTPNKLRGTDPSDAPYSFSK